MVDKILNEEKKLESALNQLLGLSHTHESYIYMILKKCVSSATKNSYTHNACHCFII